MPSFTPVSATIGGLVIGLAASLLMLSDGRIAGISGVLGGALVQGGDERPWRLSFLAGLLVGGFVLLLAAPATLGPPPTASYATLGIAGVLVGYGTRLGNGCTSGHGVCGLARTSPRSLVAVITFMAVAALTVFVTRHVMHGGAG